MGRMLALLRAALMGLGVVFLVGLALHAAGFPRESAPAASALTPTTAGPVTVRGRATDIPCYRVVGLTSASGETTVIDLVYSGPKNETYCNAGNPLDGRRFDGFIASEGAIDQLPQNLHYNCQASLTPQSDPEDVMVLVYDNRTVNSFVAASHFCQGIRDNQPGIVLTGRRSSN